MLEGIRARCPLPVARGGATDRLQLRRRYFLYCQITEYLQSLQTSTDWRRATMRGKPSAEGN